MFRFTKGRWVSAAFAGFLLWCLAAPAHAQETQYLPDGCFLVNSVDVAGFLKSKLFADAKAKIKGIDEEMLRHLKEQLGFPTTNVAKLTWGIAVEDEKRREEDVMIITTVKPVPAADIKANRKVHPFQRNFMYREVKAGKHTIYVENFSYDIKQAPHDGQAFCVVDKNVILYSRRFETLASILNADKKRKLSPGLESGLKAAGSDGMLTLVLDVTKFPADAKRSMLRELGPMLPGLADAIDNMQTFTLKATADDKVKATASMTCKDADAASDIRKLADAGIVVLKAQLKKEAEREFNSPEEKAAINTFAKSLDAIKLSTKGAQVNAEVTVDNATALTIIEGMFRPKRVEKKEFKDDK